MAIDATQVMAPNGPLDPAPGEDSNVFRARVDILVTNAYADPRVQSGATSARRDAMAKALASYEGLMADYRRMLREPNAVKVDEKGSHAYTDAQREGVYNEAQRYLAAFEALIDTPVVTTRNDVPGVYVPSFVVQ